MKKLRIALAASTLILLLFPVCVHAEVMDKELSVPQIWLTLLLALLVCAAATAVLRWLLVLSFVAGLLMGLAFAWSEWYGPHVGPAIIHEAGASYGIHTNTALTVIILAHIALWYLSPRSSLVNRWRPPPKTLMLPGRKQTLAYAFLIGLVLLMLGGPQYAVAKIWISPPSLITAIFLIWAVFHCLRAAKAQS